MFNCYYSYYKQLFELLYFVFCLVLSDVFISEMGLSTSVLNQTRFYYDAQSGELSYEGRLSTL